MTIEARGISRHGELICSNKYCNAIRFTTFKGPVASVDNKTAPDLNDTCQKEVRMPSDTESSLLDGNSHRPGLAAVHTRNRFKLFYLNRRLIAIFNLTRKYLGAFYSELFVDVGRDADHGTDISCVCAGPYVIFG